MPKQYSKVLIIGNTFHKKGGGGITMTNLFDGWPRNKLAVATDKISMSDGEVCANYYQLGVDEDIRPYIFDVFRRKRTSGPIKLRRKPVKNAFSEDAPKEKSLLKKTIGRIRDFLHDATEKTLVFLGVHNYVYRFELSERLLSWIMAFNPDVIYCQVSKLSLVRFVNEIHKITKIPYAVHIMDDHYKTMIKGGLLTPYWNRVLKHEYTKLLRNSYARLCISEAMSIEFQKRFDLKFTYFHNPIKKASWTPYMRKSWKAGKPFTVLYAGRIGVGTKESLTDVAGAVQQLSSEGLDIQLHIYTPEKDHHLFKGFSAVIASDMVNHSLMPKLLSEADLLVIPLYGVDEESKNYIKFSMPTKASEFMITGTPVLVYSSSDNALTKDAKTNAWAYVVDELNVKALKSAITNLYENNGLREALGKRGQEFALEKHVSERVCEDFRKTICITKTGKPNGSYYYI